MRIFRIAFLAISSSLLLTCCERVELTASEEQLLISHLGTLREVNREMINKNRLSLLQIKSNVFGNGRRTGKSYPLEDGMVEFEFDIEIPSHQK